MHASLVRATVVLTVIIGLLGFVTIANQKNKLAECVFYIPAGSQNKCVDLEIADNAEARQTGLSNRDNITSRGGMLFVFDEPNNACMWMKNMRFNLDIIWLGEEGTISQIKYNVSPNTYPQKFCVAEKAKYVIEVKAGAANLAGLTVGQKLDIKL